MFDTAATTQIGHLAPHRRTTIGTRPRWRPRPLVVGLGAFSPIVSAGLRQVLGSFEDRLSVVDLSSAALSVALFDPVLSTNFDIAALPTTCRRVALVAENPAQSVKQARDLGVHAVIHLGTPVPDLVDALESAGRGPDTESQDRLSEKSDSGPQTCDSDRSVLTPRESAVIAGICHGLSNAEIAAHLFLSINTIKTYIRSAYRKMRVESRTQAVLWGHQHGLGTSTATRAAGFAAVSDEMLPPPVQAPFDPRLAR